MKKKLLPAVLLLLALWGAAGLYGSYRHHQQYITIHGVEYPRDLERLTFTVGLPDEPEEYARLTQVQTIDLLQAQVTVEEYDALRRAMPQCEILWNIPFQGAAYPMDTQTLTVQSLTAQDVAELAYFPALQTLDARQCPDFDQVAAVLEAYPALDVRYQVPLGDGLYPEDTVQLCLADADVAQLLEMLRYLPALETLSLEGTLPEPQALAELTARYPQIRFYWQVELWGVTADVDTRELDLSGLPIGSLEAVEEAAAYLPALEKVYMMDCGIPDEEMAALNARWEPLFVWNVRLNAYLTVRSDATVFAPVLLGTQVWDQDLVKLKYCTELVVIDLGHMEITSCEFLRDMEKLEYLILADTRIRDITPLENLKNLKYLELFMSPVADYSPLLGCTALEDLNISLTFADPKPLEQMTWLKRLWWAGNQLEEDQQEALRAALPDTQTVFFAYGSTGGGWREGELYYKLRDLMGLPYMT